MLKSYLDHAATSPMREEVLSAYTDALKIIGNPASTHGAGQIASAMLEQARHETAAFLGCDPAEVIFTSGGTESINLGIKGLFWSCHKSDANRKTILIPKAEHHASMEAAEWLEKNSDAEVFWLDVNEDGVLTPEILVKAIDDIGPANIALLSFLWVNNEVGSIADVLEITKAAKEHGILVHIDAVAALGQLEINFKETGADMVSFSAHKIGGPPGTGAVLVSRRVSPEALFHGGSQQRSRAGSQNVASAVGFAKALEVAHCEEGLIHMQNLRNHLIERVLETVPEATLRGSEPGPNRIPGNAHFTFSGCQGDSLLFLLDAEGIAVSVGSACQAGVQEISHVLLAMGLPEEEAIGSLRMTLSPQTTMHEIESLISVLPGAVFSAKKAGLSSIEVTAQELP